jgi:hypothetical protein
VAFLKFGRDRRGYESTFLLHAARGSGPGEPRLLYWFRTPPHVKVGRAAFDEDAIRLLEQEHPGLEFDWDRILTARPPAAPEPRDPREVRSRARPERRPGREGRREAPPAPPAPAPRPVVVEPEQVVEASVQAAELVPAEPLPAAEPIVTLQPPPAEPSPARRFVRVFDQQTMPHHATELAAAERLLGAEQLTVLRARYAEILARIAARGGDPARVEALREQAETVNPDSWVTDADVQVGMASVEQTLAELHRIVGRRRRRRRRRGKGGPNAAESPQTAPPNQPSEDGDDEGDDEGPEGDEGAL